MSSFDKIDWEIINCLGENVRMSAAEIARRVGIERRTVLNRLKKLLNEEIVKPTIIFSPQIFGYKIIVDIFLTVDPDKEEKIVEVLRELPEVVYLAYSSGEHDISVQCVFKDSNSLYNFKRELVVKLPGIRRLEIVFTPKVLISPCQWKPSIKDFKNIKKD